MFRVGIIASESTFYPKIKEMILKMKSQYGPTISVFTGGNTDGVEQLVKKTCLEYGVKYGEFNPSYTGFNQHSMLKESYYGRGFHPSHIPHRYDMLLKHIDRLIIVVDRKIESKLIQSIYKKALKQNIKTVCLS